MKTEAKKTKGERDNMVGCAKLEKLFRIPETTVIAKDGSKRKLILEHRLGSKVGTFTRDELFTKTGLEKEFYDYTDKLIKKFPDVKTKNALVDSLEKRYRARLSSWVKAFRSSLISFYSGQRIRPIMAFVPVRDIKKPELFIQGYIDTESLVPILGEVEDITLAIEAQNAQLKRMVDEYEENRRIAKKALSLPGLNKDLQYRLDQLASGTLEKTHLLERIEQKKDKEESK